MQEFNVEAVRQCLSEGREEVEATFKRALDAFGTLKLEDVQRGNWASLLPSDWGKEGGLHIRFQLQQGEVHIALPESSGLLPDWINHPDATGEARLATLAQELSILLFPPDWSIVSSEAKAVACLGAALEGLRSRTESEFLSIPVLTPDNTGRLILGLCGSPRSAEPNVAQPLGTSYAVEAEDVQPQAKSQSTAVRGHHSNRVLPLLTHSLLRIRLPLEVTLARTRKPLLELLQLSPGAIIQFEKSCEEPLDLSINGHVIARGEAVKVGDKFGLRILEMTPPPERYIILGPRSARQDNNQR